MSKDGLDEDEECWNGIPIFMEALAVEIFEKPEAITSSTS
jgi:hypothetical protein